MTNPVTAISRAVRDHEDLRALLEATHSDVDPQTLLDTLEGETDLCEALQAIASQALDHEAMAAATQARIEALQARKARSLKTAETLRAIVLQAMDTTGRTDKPIVGPELTLSVSKRAGKIEIVDESQIPSKFFKPEPPKLDKKLLTAEAKESDVPGCRIGNGSISLTIRVK